MSFRKPHPSECYSIDLNCWDVWLPRAMQSASWPIPSPCGFQCFCFQQSGVGPCHFQDFLFSFPEDGEAVLRSGQRWAAWRGQSGAPWFGVRRQLAESLGLPWGQADPTSVPGWGVMGCCERASPHHPLVSPFVGHGLPGWPLLWVTCPSFVFFFCQGLWQKEFRKEERAGDARGR